MWARASWGRYLVAGLVQVSFVVLTSGLPSALAVVVPQYVPHALPKLRLCSFGHIASRPIRRAEPRPVRSIERINVVNLAEGIKSPTFSSFTAAENLGDLLGGEWSRSGEIPNVWHRTFRMQYDEGRPLVGRLNVRERIIIRQWMGLNQQHCRMIHAMGWCHSMVGNFDGQTWVCGWSEFHEASWNSSNVGSQFTPSGILHCPDGLSRSLCRASGVEHGSDGRHKCKEQKNQADLVQAGLVFSRLCHTTLGTQVGILFLAAIGLVLSGWGFIFFGGSRIAAVLGIGLLALSVLTFVLLLEVATGRSNSDDACENHCRQDASSHPSDKRNCFVAPTHAPLPYLTDIIGQRSARANLAPKRFFRLGVSMFSTEWLKRQAIDGTTQALIGAVVVSAIGTFWTAASDNAPSLTSVGWLAVFVTLTASLLM